MKRALIVVLLLTLLLVAGFAGFRALNARAQQAQRMAYETRPARRGDLQVLVSATGVVRAAQSALLVWQAPGTVESVSVETGDLVSAGQVLASLEQASLPRALILAGADLVEAQRALDDVLQSQTKQAQAQQAVQQAEQALEDALSPQAAQASAFKAVAKAQKAVETAQRNLDILQTPASPQAIDAARATLLLWENALKSTRQEIERVNGKLKSASANEMSGESRDLYETLLLDLAQRLVRYQRLYEDAQQRYQRLLQPPSPHDLEVARADLELAQAQLAQAQREQERLKDGTDPADIAVLQAQLDDDRRLAERLKGGPDPDEVVAAKARLAAAQAALDMSRQAAPFDGVVTEVDVHPGDIVSAGASAFRLDDLSALLVELKVSEVDVNRIQPGQAVTLTFDAVPRLTYAGVVTEVPAVGNLDNGVVSFRIKVAMSDADSRVRPAMTASAAVIVAELKDALLVPAQSVRFLAGQRVVYVLREDQLVPVQVLLGLSSGGEVQVLEGDIQPGEAVLLNPPVQEGGE
jgi:HlyD family secretion protein